MVNLQFALKYERIYRWWRWRWCPKLLGKRWFYKSSVFNKNWTHCYSSVNSLNYTPYKHEFWYYARHTISHIIYLFNLYAFIYFWEERSNHLISQTSFIQVVNVCKSQKSSTFNPWLGPCKMLREHKQMQKEVK